MERATIIVKGDVQRVGYRDVVEKIARKSRLTGYVENIKPYDVRIVVEGEKQAIKAFIEQVTIRKHLINVENVEASYGKPTGEYTYFEIKRGDMTEELSERIDMAGSIMYDMKNLQEESLKKQDQTIEKIDSGNKSLGGKLDNVGGKLDVFHQDTIGRFDVVDEKYGKISLNIDRAIESINKTSENIAKILEKSEKDRKEFQERSDRMYDVLMKLVEKRV